MCLYTRINQPASSQPLWLYFLVFKQLDACILGLLDFRDNKCFLIRLKVLGDSRPRLIYMNGSFHTGKSSCYPPLWNYTLDLSLEKKFPLTGDWSSKRSAVWQPVCILSRLSINFPLQMQGGDNSQAQFARGAHRALCPLSLCMPCMKVKDRVWVWMNKGEVKEARKVQSKEEGCLLEWMVFCEGKFDCKLVISQHFDFTSQYVCTLSLMHRNSGYVVKAEGVEY